MIPKAGMVVRSNLTDNIGIVCNSTIAVAETAIGMPVFRVLWINDMVLGEAFPCERGAHIVDLVQLDQLDGAQLQNALKSKLASQDEEVLKWGREYTTKSEYTTEFAEEDVKVWVPEEFDEDPNLELPLDEDEDDAL